jgi:hypothetical protein
MNQHNNHMLIILEHDQLLSAQPLQYALLANITALASVHLNLHTIQLFFDPGTGRPLLQLMLVLRSTQRSSRLLNHVCITGFIGKGPCRRVSIWLTSLIDRSGKGDFKESGDANRDVITYCISLFG